MLMGNVESLPWWSAELCIGCVMPKTRQCAVNLFCRSSNSLIKASAASGTSNLARASLKALQYQVLHTNWFGSSLQPSSCHLSLHCSNGSLNLAVWMLKSIERLMQTHSHLCSPGKDPKKKKIEIWVPRCKSGRTEKAQSCFGIFYFYLPSKLFCGVYGFSTVFLFLLKAKTCLEATLFTVNECLHYTRWHCLILTFFSCLCCAGSLDLEHPVAATSSVLCGCWQWDQLHRGIGSRHVTRQ